jgi:hypothetical protein
MTTIHYGKVYAESPERFPDLHEMAERGLPAVVDLRPRPRFARLIVCAVLVVLGLAIWMVWPAGGAP